MKIWLILIFSVVVLLPGMLITGTFIYEYRHVHTKTLNVVEISGNPAASELPVRVSASAMFDKSSSSRCLQYSIKVREFQYSKWWICVIPEEKKLFLVCSYIGPISVFHHTYVVMDPAAETDLLSKLKTIAPEKTIW